MLILFICSVDKVLVMMIGEYDFDSNFTWEEVGGLSGGNGSAQVLFVIFLFLSSVTISNLIVGLTVNKTEELFREAGVIRLEKTVLQIRGLEDIIVKKPSMADYLPGKWVQPYKERTQLFEYLESVAEESGVAGECPTKVCIRPYEQRKRRGVLFFKEKDIKGGVSNMGALYEDGIFPLYLYNEKKMSKGSKVDINIPGWIVRNTIEAIRSRDDNDIFVPGIEMFDDVDDDKVKRPSRHHSMMGPPPQLRKASTIQHSPLMEHLNEDDDGVVSTSSSSSGDEEKAVNRLSRLNEELSQSIKDLKKIKRLSQVTQDQDDDDDELELDREEIKK